ncbi:MAG TPA: sigma-70 family RNA polymerase sigma factor [Tenericutes bacterium]|nr:sigma-70 family RNA polymerase sigma factor [Mycoplasmatota bacterium]
MDYKDYNDYELLSYVSEKSEEAHNIIFEKYRPLIVSYSKKMLMYSNNLGIDLNDLVQEGMIGLSIAINTFDQSRDVTFYTYAKRCIENKIISLVIASTRQKHKILNESISFDMTLDDDNFNLEKLIGDNTNNPERLIISSETESEIIEKLKKVLTDYEYQVFELKRSGFSYKEIADILDKDAKAIDNTIQRIKNKFKTTIIM